MTGVLDSCVENVSPLLGLIVQRVFGMSVCNVEIFYEVLRIVMWKLPNYATNHIKYVTPIISIYSIYFYMIDPKRDKYIIPTLDERIY